MSLNFIQFHAGVVVPTLKQLDPVIPYSKVADMLTSETIWHESDQLRALGQYPVGGVTEANPFGPGLGVCSMERDTWDWLVGNFIDNPLIGRRYEELAYDLRLCVQACRFRYRVDARALPRLEDGVEARATYWWRIYNSGQVDRRPDYIRNARAISWA